YQTAKELGFLKPYNKPSIKTFNKAARPQNNYSFRRLLQKQFMVLKPQAQEVVMRVLQSQNLPSDKQTISLVLEPSNPDYPQLVSLIDQGVLEKIEEPTKDANKVQTKAFPMWFATDHPEKLEAAQKRSVASGLMTWEQMSMIS
ncbi:MAG: hypothetical protein K2X66_15520, partial [Cyanobacteria bacterium]|nr:hypothetical protein [Cyanobacteriota bacterium]